jgi:hypothetical protein
VRLEQQLDLPGRGRGAGLFVGQHQALGRGARFPPGVDQREQRVRQRRGIAVRPRVRHRAAGQFDGAREVPVGAVGELPRE